MPRTTLRSQGTSTRQRKRSGWSLPMLSFIGFSAIFIATGCQPSPTLLSTGTSQQTPSGANSILWRVGHTDLTATITEQGKLQSQSNERVFCEVGDVPGDDIQGTRIIWIVENGATVSEGDLLVELDATPHQERLDQQIIAVEQARRAKIEAEAKQKSLQGENALAKAAAEYKVARAELDVQMYRDPDSGINAKNVAAVQRRIEQLEQEASAAYSLKQLKKTDLEQTEELLKQQPPESTNPISTPESRLDRARLDYWKADQQYAKKMNELKTAQATLVKERTYERETTLFHLNHDLDTARRQLQQQMLNNDAKLTQAKAKLSAATESLKKHEEIFARRKKQLEKCKIYAPTNGMIVYNSPDPHSQDSIGPGAVVRRRQCIMCFPNLAAMEVRANVCQEAIGHLAVGQSAVVRVAGYPDRGMAGTVKSIGALPENTGVLQTANVMYSVVVTVDEEAAGLVPGMSANVQFKLDLNDVLTVPREAVFRERGKSWCHVKCVDRIERRLIRLGVISDDCCQVLEGLTEGEQVVVSPQANAL